MSLVSFPSWENEIKGSYICNYKILSDGSTDTMLIKVSSSGLKSQYLDMKGKSEYKLIDKNSKTGVSVFQWHNSILILSPTNNDKIIKFNKHRFVIDDENKDRLSRGSCKRSYVN